MEMLGEEEAAKSVVNSVIKITSVKYAFRTQVPLRHIVHTLTLYQELSTDLQVESNLVLSI